MTTGAEWSDDTIVDRWSRLGIEPHTFELDSNGTLQSQLHGGARAGDTVIEALGPFERAQLALNGEIKLGREIGRGGLAVVRSATQRSLGRDVAVKQALADDPGAAYRLVREARILAALDHPNIIPVHMLGIDESERPLMVMKRVDGIRWREYVSSDGVLSSPEEGDVLEWHLRVLMAVCQVAQYAHAYGIIHRDLKLENVMIGSLGEVYVVDWDLALAVDPTLPLDIPLAAHEVEVLGTPEYMAPEMALVHADQLGPRTDVYQLGACLHTVLTGRPRHDEDTVIARLYAAARSEPLAYPESLPDELGAIANRATSLEPVDRYRSADAFRNALVDFLLHRASLRLSAAATARLDELESLIGTTDPNDAYHLQLLVGECRFGFGQALDEWPDNPDAAAGLRLVQLHALEHALRVGQADRAEVILADLVDPPPEAVVRIDELRSPEATSAARQRAGRPPASLSATLRSRIMLEMAALWGVGLGLLALFESSMDHDTALPALGIVIAIQALAVAATAVLRAPGLQLGAHNRAFSQLLSVGAFLPVLLWPVMAIVGGHVEPALLAVEIALLIVFIAAAVALDRRLWGPSALLGTACFCTALAPGWGLALAALGIGGAYGLTGMIWRRGAG